MPEGKWQQKGVEIWILLPREGLRNFKGNQSYFDGKRFWNPYLRCIKSQNKGKETLGGVWCVARWPSRISVWATFETELLGLPEDVSVNCWNGILRSDISGHCLQTQFTQSNYGEENFTAISSQSFCFHATGITTQTRLVYSNWCLPIFLLIQVRRMTWCSIGSHWEIQKIFLIKAWKFSSTSPLI